MLVAALVLFLFRDSIFGASEVVNVLDGAASDVRSAQAVIIRDELPRRRRRSRAWSTWRMSTRW